MPVVIAVNSASTKEHAKEEKKAKQESTDISELTLGLKWEGGALIVLWYFDIKLIHGVELCLVTFFSVNTRGYRE